MKIECQLKYAAMLNFLLCKIVYLSDFHFIFCIITPRYHSVSTKCESSFRTTISPWELSQQIPQTLNPIRQHMKKIYMSSYLCLFVKLFCERKTPQFQVFFGLQLLTLLLCSFKNLYLFFTKNGSNLCLFKKKRKMKGHPNK